MAARVERKLTTILAADAVGYSRAMAADEEAALLALRAAREVFGRLIDRHRGRIFSKAGDGLLAEFPSVVEAVQCAVEVQRELAGRNAAPGTTQFRIGIHLGDVMVDGDDLFGDGVNLAARLEGLAEPGGILISQPVYDQVRSKLAVGFDYLGTQRPKNLGSDVPVYRVALDGGAGTRPDEAEPTGQPAGKPARRLDPARLRRHAQGLGIAWLGLFGIDLLTGPTFWAHWPGIVMLTVLGLEAAALLAGRRLTRIYARLAVLLGGLALVNLATWSGTLWVVWPALGFTIVAAFLGITSKAHRS